MREALFDRNDMVRRQQRATDALLHYQWKDVARAYFETMSGLLDGSVVHDDSGGTRQAVYSLRPSPSAFIATTDDLLKG